MVLPAAIAGARVIAGAAARGGARKAATRRGGRTAVRGARVINATRQQRGDTRTTERYQPPTTDQVFSQTQYGAGNNAVLDTRARRLAAKATEAAYQPKKSLWADRAQTAQRSIRRNYAPKKSAQTASRAANQLIQMTTKIQSLVLLSNAYLTFFFFWILQLAGFMLLYSTTNAADSLPKILTVAASAGLGFGLASGFMFLITGYCISLLILLCINGYIIVRKKITRGKALIWLAVTVLPLVHIASLGIWFTRAEKK